MFDSTSEALAYLLGLLTTANLNRFIGSVTEERTATHHRMVGGPGQPHPAISPMSEEWKTLSSRYDMLAALTDAAYSELLRRAEDERACADDVADAAQLSRIESSACDA